MPADTQERTITHTGGVLGSENVQLAQNQTSPQRQSAVIRFSVPRKFDNVEYVGERDATRFVPRTMVSTTISDADGSAALEEDERTVAVPDIQPIHGERDIPEQEYPVVVAYNVTQGAEITASDLTVSYARNEVTIADSAVAAGDDVKLYPILNVGDVQYQLVNQFDQQVGTVYPWSTPIYRWHDMKQLQRGRQINLHGSVTWEENEWLEVLLDSSEKIVWTDADYPRGQFVSRFEQDVKITI